MSLHARHNLKVAAALLHLNLRHDMLRKKQKTQINSKKSLGRSARERAPQRCRGLKNHQYHSEVYLRYLTIYIYIYIYMVPPPQRSTKFNATTDIVGYFRLQDCPEVCWQNLGSRLKPIEPIEISIGTKIQDPRFPGKTPEQSWILDLGSWSRLKFQSV